MSIPIVCEHCFSPFKIPEKYAGKTVRCKACGEGIRVPSASQSRSREETAFGFDDFEAPAATRGLPPRSQSSPSPRRRAKPRSSRKNASPSGGLIGWLPFIVGGVFVLFLPAALFVPKLATAYVILGVLAGWALNIWGSISLLIFAFRESVQSGLLCLFVSPVYVIYKVFTDWRRVAQPMKRLFVSTGIFVAVTVVMLATMPPRNRGAAPQPGARLRQQAGPQVRPQSKRQPQQPSVAKTPAPIDDRSPYPLSNVNPILPRFNTDKFHKMTIDGADIYSSHLRQGNPTNPGGRTFLRVYLPPGEHPDGSLPCVLVPPSGTFLMAGSQVVVPPQNPEHSSYVRAGYAVITFSLDGIMGDPETASPALLASAYRQFQAAFAGLTNARIAFLFARKELSAVDPKRIYIAGHSSAATLALLYAAHDPELAGCIAYAPVTDVEEHLAKAVETLNPQLFPGLKEFSRRSSPKTHAARIRCPVFVYHATGDTVAPFASTKAFCDRLRALGKDITFVEGNGSDHYETMISEGIPAGLEWLSNREASVGSPAVPSLIADNPDSRAAPPPSDHRQSLGDVDLSENESVRVGTAPLQPDTELVPGMRVIAKRGLWWEGAEIIEVQGSGKIKVHYLQSPAAFDKVLPRSEVRLQLPADQIDEEFLQTAVIKVLHYFGDGPPDLDAIESEYLMMEGYLPGSLKLDPKSQSVSVQVVRGSDADKNAIFPLIKARASVRRIEEPARSKSREK